MGGSSSRTVADRQTSIQIQSSSYGSPIPVVYGTNRISANLVWFGNFKANTHTAKTGGKGMGGSSTNTTYTYSAAAILALAEGTISGIGSVWKDKDKTTLAALGLTLFTGTPTQSVWSFLSGYSTIPNFGNDITYGYYNALFGIPPSTAFVDQAINYSSTAYLCASAYDLGDAASVPNHSFEVMGKLIVGGGTQDANPADIVPDILTSQQYGMNFAGGKIDALTDYRTYCRAAGIYFSPAYTQARATSDCIQELADASNSAPVWSGGKLKVIPYGDTSVTGNGVTYTPNLTPLYDLADDDFYDNGGPPILITRVTPADAYNRVQVEFRNRLNQYNQEIVSVEDQDAIEQYGLKIAPVLTMDFICDSAVAKQVAQLALQRMLYKRNKYEFELTARYAMLEPMDIVTLTDIGLGMSRTPVRIIEISEQDDSFKVTAEDLPIGIASASTYLHDDGLRWQNSTAIPPQTCAAPVLFELPADASATGLSVGIAVGGQPGDLAYGGCNVWLSLDGVNYRQEGTIWGSSRYGTLSSTLAAHAAGMDTTNTAGLSLRSDGQMISGSAQDVANGSTLVVCDGEYFAFQTATLTGTRAYNLTTLNRGLYGTPSGSHASGATWVRIDGAIATLPDLDLTLIGQTVYIKLTAFNVYGAAEQPLSAVSAYSYTITGNMKALETPVDFADITGATKPANNATRNDAGANMLEAPLLMNTGFAATSGAFREDTGAGGAGRDRYRIRLDNDGAQYWIQGNTRIQLSASERLWLKGWFYAGSGTTGVCQFGLVCEDAAGTVVGNIAGPVHPASAGTNWYAIEVSAPVPAGAAFGRPYFQRYGGVNGGGFFLAEPSITRQQPGATRNIVTYASSAPSSPADGDLWVDTSATYAVFRLWSGGAWVVGANALSAYNALSGKPVALADINTTESTKLAGIAPGADVTSANTAANTSAVSSIPATSVANTINSGGGVAANKVDTAAVQPNAITISTSAYTAGAQNCPVSTPTTIQSATMTSSGAAISIIGGAVFTVAGAVNADYNVEVLRSGTSIYAATVTGSGAYTPFSIAISDTPGAGSFTYTIRITATFRLGIFTNSSLLLLETKR